MVKKFTNNQIQAIAYAAKRELSRRYLLDFTKHTMPEYDDGAWFHRSYMETLERFESGEIKNLMVFMPPQHGKFFEHDTPVLTTGGWKRHIDLKAGDIVFGEYGEQRQVLNNFGGYMFECQRVVFDKAKSLVAGTKKEWKVRLDGKNEYIKETNHLFDLKSTTPLITKGNENHFIVGIKDVGLKYGNCIQVDGGMYLVGKDLIPTHNSEPATRRLPAFRLGKNPNCKIGIVAYAATLAEKFNKEIQRIMDSPEYLSLFPDTTLYQSAISNVKTRASYLRNATEFEIVNKKGSLVSVGTGGGLTSRQIDLLIMDDLYKDAADAWSESYRANVEEWYFSVARARLHNDSQQLLVFTRWHEEDLAGRLLKTEPDKWRVVIFPALKIGSPTKDDPREDGEALWEAKHSRAELLDIKEQNEIVFESLYQQNPTPKEGLLFPEAEMKRFRKTQIEKTKPDGIISACDIADEGSDSLCHPVGYVFGKDIYIMDVNFSKDPVEVTQPLVATMIDKHKVDRSVFESNAGGKMYAQRVRDLKKGRADIRWRITTTNKLTRILLKSGEIKGHVYFLVDEEQSKEYKNYFYELTHFPRDGKIKHDDAVDGTTMLLEVLVHKRKRAVLTGMI